MNLLQALLQTYNAAEEAGLVDVWKESEPMLLPLYHSSRQSRGEDIVQLTISAGISVSWTMMPGMAFRKPLVRKISKVIAPPFIVSSSVCTAPQTTRPASIAATMAL